jgi:hypothetical protein
MDNTVKLLRLQSGEDIIADIIEDEQHDAVLVSNPMTVIFKRLPTGRAVMMMAPWLPIELIEVNAATLYTADILTIIEPKASLIEYYQNACSEAKELMDDEDVDEALQSHRNDVRDNPTFSEVFNEEDDELEVQDEEDIELDRMNEILKGTRKRLLH